MNMPFVSHAGPLSSSCCRRLRFMTRVQHTTNRIHEASLAALTSMYSRHSPTDSSKIMLPGGISRLAHSDDDIRYPIPRTRAALHSPRGNSQCPETCVSTEPRSSETPPNVDRERRQHKAIIVALIPIAVFLAAASISWFISDAYLSPYQPIRRVFPRLNTTLSP